MDIEWQVEDGYVGKGRPQITEIDEDDILDYDTVDEAMDFINECIREDFEQTVSWGVDNWDEIKDNVRKMLENRDKNLEL